MPNVSKKADWIKIAIKNMVTNQSAVHSRQSAKKQITIKQLKHNK